MTNPITYTYAGDSITDPDNSWSWLNGITDPNLTNLGGTAISGADSAMIRNAITEPIDADVLVVMVGTNDVRRSYTPTSVISNIQEIVDTISARHVVIAALPPSNLTEYQLKPGTPPTVDRAVQGFAMSRSLQAYAATQDWGWVDPYSSVRRFDGTWAPGTAQLDGVHPTPTTGTTYGSPRMATAIRTAVNGANA